MERLTERIDGWVMRKGCHGPCRTCPGAECTDLYPVIDRLAAYEDTGLTPEEIEEAKDSTDAKFILWVSRAWGLAEGRLHEILRAEKDGRLAILPPNDPLTLEELQGMGGEPVWCLEMRCWGIIKLETIGEWAGMPFLIGTLHDCGVAVDFEFDVIKRALTLYRQKPEEG